MAIHTNTKANTITTDEVVASLIAQTDKHQLASKRNKTMTSSKLRDSVAEKIAANTLILELHIRGPMFKKGVSSKRILDRGNGNGNGSDVAGEEAGNENGAINPDRIHISKDLIDQKQLKA